MSQTEAAGSGQPTGTTVFSYDPEYRLLTADYPGTSDDEAYSYDKVGNRKTLTQGALTLTANSLFYSYNAGNWLTGIKKASATPPFTGTGPVYESYLYDPNGSLLKITGNRKLTLTWDANNRVSKLNTTSYDYDPAGYRNNKAIRHWIKM